MSLSILLLSLAVIACSISALRLNREVRRLRSTMNDLQRETKRAIDLQKTYKAMIREIEKLTDQLNK